MVLYYKRFIGTHVVGIPDKAKKMHQRTNGGIRESASLLACTVCRGANYL